MDPYEPPLPPPPPRTESALGATEKVCTHSLARLTPMWKENDSFVISLMYSYYVV